MGSKEACWQVFRRKGLGEDRLQEGKQMNGSLRGVPKMKEGLS